MGIADHRFGLRLSAVLAVSLAVAASSAARAERPPLPAERIAPLPSGLRVPASQLVEFQTPVPPADVPPPGSEQLAAPFPEGQPTEVQETSSGPCPVGPCCCIPNRWRDTVKPWLQATHWGYPELFIEAPAGSSVHAHACRQIMGGLAGQMVLYRYDFHDEVLPDAARLNDHGQRRLEKMSALLQNGLYPVVIERAVANPELDAQRRQNVLDALKNPLFEVPEPWVVLGRPAEAGFSAVEAAEVYKNLLQHTRSGTQGASTGGGMGVGIGTGGTMASPTNAGRGGGY